MANPTPIIFTLTDAGLNAALDAQNNGLTLKLSKVAVGTGKYNSSAAQNRTGLATQWGEFALAGAGIEPNSKTLRFSAIIKSSVQKDVFEIGLLSDNGVLFAVASTTGSAPLFAVSENVDYIGAFGLTITSVPINYVQVVVDTNAALAIALMQQHLAQPNPHPQYVLKNAPVMTADAQAPAYAKKDAPQTGLFFDGTDIVFKNSGNEHGRIKNVALEQAEDSLALATTQWVKDLITAEINKIQDIEIGDLFITTRNFANGDAVAAHKKYGKWARFGDGQALVTQLTSYRSTAPEWMKTIGATGGEDNHTLTIAEMPSHNHNFHISGQDSGTPQKPDGTNVDNPDALITTSDTGGDQPHNNIQPSIIIQAWKRLNDDGSDPTPYDTDPDHNPGDNNSGGSGTDTGGGNGGSSNPSALLPLGFADELGQSLPLNSEYYFKMNNGQELWLNTVNGFAVEPLAGVEVGKIIAGYPVTVTYQRRGDDGLFSYQQVHPFVPQSKAMTASDGTVMTSYYINQPQLEDLSKQYVLSSTPMEIIVTVDDKVVAAGNFVLA